MTSALPTGGVDAGQEAQLTNPDVNPNAPLGAGGAGWRPPFRLGGGHPGVLNDARGLISGQAADASGQITAASVAAAGDAMYKESAAVGATGGVGPLDVGGPVAGSLPTGGAGPTPKATSQAQRDANNAQAQQENPGYVGAG